jgi:hypothetical protein
MLDLDAIEARAEAASEGPWSNVDGASSMIHCEDGYVGTVPFPPNAYFIAHARTDIPALVAELRAAREVVEAAPVAITLRTDEAFYGAMNRLADALAAYRAVVGAE